MSKTITFPGTPAGFRAAARHYEHHAEEREMARLEEADLEADAKLCPQCGSELEYNEDDPDDRGHCTQCERRGQ